MTIASFLRTARRSVLLCSVLVFGASACLAELDMEIRGGFAPDVEGMMAGVGALASMGGNGWYFNPNLEVIPAEDVDLVSANADFHYDLPVDTPFYLWLGAGPAVIHRSADFGGDDTDLGANLLVGIGGKQQTYRPFGQLKLTLSDDTEAVLMAGVRF